MAGAIVPFPAPAADFDLRFDRLSEAFTLLPEADRMSTNEVIALIRRGDHNDALARLQKLNAGHPDNSSLRVLTAYALLQVGNLVGAFDEAQKAHSAPNGNSYKCWFFSKIALLNGDIQTCKRELAHVKHAGDLRAEAKALEQDLKKRKN
jgi:Flp pilus assembly protein TadD